MLVIIFCIVIDQGELLVDFRQLETFVEVCEQMSFTKAASNLYISQQGVSKSIKTLEDELGVSLFLRTNSSISLTNYGRDPSALCGGSREQLYESPYRNQY